MSRVSRTLITVAAIVISAGALAITTPSGAFTVDESNYLATLKAFKSGSWSLPGTDRVPPSPEWYGFDPSPPFRGEPKAPIFPTAPPFWAPFALPFFAMGLRGLIFLNALSFGITVLLVYGLTALHARRASTSVLAALIFAFGGFSLEYARGIWPHMLSVVLVTFALYCAARARLGSRDGWAVLGGLAAGLACGVRYQNIVLAAAIGLGLLVTAPRKLRAAGVYCVSVGGPLLVAAFVNLHRLGLFNPLTKGHGYASLGVLGPTPPSARIVDIFLSFWTRVVDFSVHPAIALGGGAEWTADPEFGVFFAQGAIKKALLQSAPWVLLGWLLLAFFARRAPDDFHQRRAREARALALCVAGVLAMFALAGTGAHDGLCFNQRYLLELLPCAAAAVAWWVDDSDSVGKRDWLWGGLAGAALCVPMGIAEPYSWLRTEWIRFAPLVLSAVLIAAAVLSRRATPLVRALLGAAVVWAFGVHMIDDLPASERLRRAHAERLSAVLEALPSRSALFVYGPVRDALWPVAALTDCFVLDPGKDAGRDAPMLVSAMRADGRRVFVDPERFPEGMLPWIAEQSASVMRPTTGGLVELASSNE